jgi:[ribosomal protein S18]-alanine N-acetyltransferase
MTELGALCLARPKDAAQIASMSREYIENGLQWSWTPSKVQRFIQGRECSVVVARREDKISAFAIMHFGDQTAHLNLLAVAPEYRRQGLARRLMRWLFLTAEVAGMTRITLELRADNLIAKTFYENLGFNAAGLTPRYYQGVEAALRMAKPL